jgi:hypothetical protein
MNIYPAVNLAPSYCDYKVTESQRLLDTNWLFHGVVTSTDVITCLLMLPVATDKSSHVVAVIVKNEMCLLIMICGRLLM